MNQKINNLRFKLAMWIMPQIPEESKQEVKHHRAGRVAKVISPVDYDPNKPIKKGGKVVRIMPKQLKKIKESQDGQN